MFGGERQREARCLIHSTGLDNHPFWIHSPIIYPSSCRGAPNWGPTTNVQRGLCRHRRGGVRRTSSLWSTNSILTLWRAGNQRKSRDCNSTSVLELLVITLLVPNTKGTADIHTSWDILTYMYRHGYTLHTRDLQSLGIPFKNHSDRRFRLDSKMTPGQICILAPFLNHDPLTRAMLKTNCFITYTYFVWIDYRIADCNETRDDI